MPAVNGVPHQGVWDLPQVVAARDGQQSQTEIARGVRKLPDRLASCMHLVCKALCRLVFARGHEGSVICKTLLGKHVKDPLIATERELFCSPVADNLLSAGVFYRLVRPAKVLAKFLVGQVL